MADTVWPWKMRRQTVLNSLGLTSPGTNIPVRMHGVSPR